MTADVDSRLARVEERVDGLSSRITAVDNRINEVAPMLSHVAALNERVKAADKKIDALGTSLADFREKIDERDTADRDDRKQFNRWAIGLAFVIIAALIGVAGLLLSTGVHA